MRGQKTFNVFFLGLRYPVNTINWTCIRTSLSVANVQGDLEVYEFVEIKY